MNKTNEKGITLVALVVSIIVLLILASVTLAMITGENGIIAKAREAKEKTEIAAWEEKIDLAIIEAEQEKRNPTLEDVIDKLYDNDIIDDKENDVNRETGAITTNEPEYVIEGKLDDYLDNQGSTEPEEPPVYEEGDITFSYSPESMTNKDVEVTITKNVEENYTIEYSKYDTNNWKEYVSPVTMEKNGAIYARLKNSSGVSNYAAGNVSNIDKLPPNEPTIQVGEVTENSITVTASSTDKTATSEYANSGIQGYQFSKDNGESWEPSVLQASGSYTFTGLTENTTYNIKVKAIDNAGNETISSKVVSQATESGGITAGDIENNGSIFGSDVKGYEAQGVTEWKIFYSGIMPGESESHIYLISSDYIPYEVIPYSTDANGTVTSRKPNKGSNSYPRAAFFDNIVTDYIGTDRITDSKIKGLNNSYFNIKKYVSSYENIKAVAYMLDTKAWSGFMLSDKADYVIGGPTVELLFKSYNQKYGTNYVAEAINNIGYMIGQGGTTNISGFYLSNTKDPLYVITSKNNAYSYWISTPSSDNYKDCVFDLTCLGYVNYNRSNFDGFGFRPIVCLKSDIKLQDNGDGTYTVK